MKRNFLPTILLFVILCLCSCAEQTNTSAASSESEISGSVASETKQPGSNAKESILLRSKISKNLNSGVIIDADITSISRENLSAYTGKLRIFTADSANKAAAAFGLSHKDAITTQTNFAKDGMISGDQIYMKFEDDKELICGVNQLFYTTNTFLTVRELLITEGSKANANVFLTDTNLDFATIEEARAEAKALIDTLDITVVDEPLCYTMNYSTLLSENERLYSLALESLKDSEQQFMLQKNSVTEDDACYMFTYPLAVEGMPVSNRMSGVFGDGSFASGTELTVCYSKNGVVGFSLNYQPEVLKKSELKTVISTEKILQIFEAKYDSVILRGQYRVDDIRLEYIVKPVTDKENTFSFIPVWRFTMEHNFDVAKKDGSETSLNINQIEYNLFDAITGEELPIDLGGV